MPRPLTIVSQSDDLNKVTETNSHIYWQTVQIQISWFLEPTDLALHCLQSQSISGFSRIRVKTGKQARDTNEQKFLFDIRTATYHGGKFIVQRFITYQSLIKTTAIHLEFLIMLRSFVVRPASMGLGSSGAFNFSVCETLLNALQCGDKFMVKSLLKVPVSLNILINVAKWACIFFMVKGLFIWYSYTQR